jgi:hypothetical protein
MHSGQYVYLLFFDPMTLEGSESFSASLIYNSGMNYQQRNRALSECIRERCVRTGCNRNEVYEYIVEFNTYLMFHD